MSTVTSYFSIISVGGKFLQYTPTSPFNINGISYKGVISVSNTPTTFIVTQRLDGAPFHNIQLNETQYLAQVQNTNSIPAEVKAIIGDLSTFISTTNSLIKWFIISSPVPSTQSNVDLLTDTNNIFVANATQYWNIASNRLTLASTGRQFSFSTVTESNIVVGSKTVSGGGGGGGIDLEDGSGAPNYITFSNVAVDTGVTTLYTDQFLQYNFTNKALSANQVITNKIGTGPQPGDSASISIGGNALANVAGNNGVDNIAIGGNSLNLLQSGDRNIAIGKNTAANSGTAMSDTISIGENALRYNQANGIIAIGKNALAGSSLNPNTGTNNLVVGNDSLIANTSGQSNYVFGNNVLSANTTGSGNIGIGGNLLSNGGNGGNIAIGGQLLTANTSGAGNISIGGLSLNSNQDGNGNISIGISNMSANIDGNNNFAVGQQALNTNVNGGNNIAIGLTALKLNNSPAGGNIAIGKSAAELTTASDVLAIGFNSLALNTTGNNNVSIGKNSTDANTTGSNNTAIGFGTLGDLNTGNNNIAVGYLAGSNITLNDSNNIMIGNLGLVSDNNKTRIGVPSAAGGTHLATTLITKKAAILPGVGPQNLTAGNILAFSGGILVGSATSTWTLPSAADINSQLSNAPEDGDSFSFTVVNLSATDTITVTAGTNFLVPSGPRAVLPASTRVFTAIWFGADWSLY